MGGWIDEKNAMSSDCRLSFGVCHFVRRVKVGMNSRIHFRQKRLAKARGYEDWSWSVNLSGRIFELARPSNKWFGVLGSGSDGYFDSCVRGQLCLRFSIGISMVFKTSSIKVRL